MPTFAHIFIVVLFCPALASRFWSYLLWYCFPSKVLLRVDWWRRAHWSPSGAVEKDKVLLLVCYAGGVAEGLPARRSLRLGAPHRSLSLGFCSGTSE